MSNEAEESRLSPQSAADCADVVLRLFEYVDNEASEADCRQIQAHLDECGSCLREYEKDVLLKAMIRRACGCEQAPPALRAQIMTRITGLSVTSFRAADAGGVSYTEQVSYRTEWRQER